MDRNLFKLADALLDRLTPLGDMRRTRQDFDADDLDRLEIKLLDALRSIGVIRNAFAPINTLPLEILAHIFSMLIFDDQVPKPFLPDLSMREQPHAWITVTHVCRHWRETALAFPFLWSTIDSDSALAALAFLNRSAASSLRVYLRDAAYGSRYSPSLERARFMQSIAHHSNRFLELHIQPQFRYGSKILQALSRPAQHLKSLSVMLNLGKDEPQELPVLFNGRTPDLERLTLANFTTWPGNDFGPNLTHLCLLDQHPRGRMSMRDFVEFLRSCRRLQELVLVDAGPLVGFSTLETSPILNELVRLEDLRVLHIGSWPNPQSVAQFLSRLILPKDTTMHIWADCLFRRDETMAMLFPPDLTNLHPVHRLTAIHCTTRPSRRDYPQLVSVQDGMLVFISYYAGNTPDETIRSLFSVFDTRYVEEVTIGVGCSPELSATAWRAIFHALPRLRTLNLVQRPSRPILAALCRDDTADKVICPELSKVAIADDDGISSVRLFLFAEDRFEAGFPILKLEITTKMSAYSPRLETELEEMERYIVDVKYTKNQAFDVSELVTGWPTETYAWILKQRDNKGRRQ